VDSILYGLGFLFCIGAVLLTSQSIPLAVGTAVAGVFCFAFGRIVTHLATIADHLGALRRGLITGPAGRAPEAAGAQEHR
jgi:hypothetical protein